MDFLRQIGWVKTEAITPAGTIPAATKYTLSNGGSRIAVEIQAVADVYVGGVDVSADNGLVIKAGTSRVFPVNRPDSLYITGGKVIVVDYYG